jgi:hypothetical protein
MSKLSFFRAAITAVFLCVLGIGRPLSAHAGHPLPSGYWQEAPRITVNYLGVSGDYLLFDVMLEQPDPKRAYFFITDGNGNEMHAESVFGRSVVKRVMISAYESDRLIFNFNAGKGQVKKWVDVKFRNQQLVEVK